MIKIGKLPRIVQNENRWGQLEPGYYVDNYHGYVTIEMWLKIQAFESFDMKQKITSANIESIEMQIANLLVYSGGYQTWQFNALIRDLGNDISEYVRMIAVLGEKTLKKRTLLDDIYAKFLEAKCWFMNRRVEMINE